MQKNKIFCFRIIFCKLALESFRAPFARWKKDRQPYPETEQLGTPTYAISHKWSKGKPSKGRKVLSTFRSHVISSLNQMDDVAGKFSFFFFIIHFKMLFRIKTHGSGFQVRENRQFSFHSSVESLFLLATASRQGFDHIFVFAVPP